MIEIAWIDFILGSMLLVSIWIVGLTIYLFACAEETKEDDDEQRSE